MRKSIVLFAAILAMVLMTCPAFAQVLVVEAALCEDVVNREPVDLITSTDQSVLPVVEAGKTGQVFLWTKIKTSEETVVVHSWYKENPNVAELGPDMHPMSEIELRVHPSDGFRTWSTASLMPGVSEGMWRVTVTTAADPENILYQEAFQVK
ncbi:MAG: DUF2914 domain-containing protein [Desulfocurvibacter africanus]